MPSRSARDGQQRLPRFLGLVVRYRTLCQVAADAAAWTVAVVLATLLRFDLRVDDVDWTAVGVYVGVAVILQVAVGVSTGLYTGRYSYGVFEEVAALVRTAVAVGVVGTVVNRWLLPDPVPTSVPMGAAVVAIVLMGALRYAWRLRMERRQRPSRSTAMPTIVFGAGDAAGRLVTSMLRDPSSPYLPVAILDDDPAKRNLRLRGVPVVGDRDAMEVAASAHDAELLVIAIPSASGQVLRALAARAAGAGLDVRVLPPVAELLDRVDVGDVRPLSEADLLGRHAIEIDVSSIAGYLTDKRVLVTGAGGSIGSELCRQIHRFAPAKLVMLDHDESALHAVELSLHGRALLDDDRLVIADIRDRDRIVEVFAASRPEVVFHAAALKHLPLLEGQPTEGVATNVEGTRHVLDAALMSGVERFVNISTDKAADPVSVLGYTKRIAERLTAWASGEGDAVYLSVRFGNVLGSRGSVISAFEAQVGANGPVTVTDPDVTRYFMTVEEAVRLVIQAGAVGRDGEALVLDMGEPVRIAEVAQRLVAQSGRPVRIVYTGLRPGEKLHEVLRAHDEPDERPVHPLISHVPVPPLPPETLDALCGTKPDGLVERLRSLCTLAASDTVAGAWAPRNDRS